MAKSREFEYYTTYYVQCIQGLTFSLSSYSPANTAVNISEALFPFQLSVMHGTHISSVLAGIQF